MAVTRLLLDAGARTDVANDCGWAALMAASQQGHSEIVRLLLEAGANEDLANRDNFTSVMVAARNLLAQWYRVPFLGSKVPFSSNQHKKATGDMLRK